jgi:hypothetical protein
VPLGGLTRIITVEMSKLREVAAKPVEAMNEQERWAVYFHYYKDESKRNLIHEILSIQEDIAMTQAVLQTIARDHAEQARITTALKNRLDYDSGMWSAEQRGIQRVAYRAIAQGWTAAQVMAVTGLSLAELESLKHSHMEEFA